MRREEIKPVLEGRQGITQIGGALWEQVCLCCLWVVIMRATGGRFSERDVWPMRVVSTLDNRNENVAAVENVAATLNEAYWKLVYIQEIQFFLF